LSTLLDDAFAHHVWATAKLIDACTAITSLRVEPPIIDVWEFGKASGRSVEVEPQMASPERNSS
jgi:hypothetical protein